MKRGAWKKDTTRVPKLQTSGGFRFVRVFTSAHNAMRIQAYAKRLRQQARRQPDERRFRLRLRVLAIHKNKSPASPVAT